MRTQKCFAVKPGINGMLDVARRTYTEIVDDISSTIHSYSEQTELPMRSAFSSAKDFHIQLQLAPGSNEPPPLPAQFIKVTKSKNRMLFTTQELIHYNNRVKESLNEIYLMTNLVLSNLMEGIRENIGNKCSFGSGISNLYSYLSRLSLQARRVRSYHGYARFSRALLHSRQLHAS